MLLKETGLTAQDIKDKVNKYMIETYERFEFVAETAKDMYIRNEKGEAYLDFYAGVAVNSVGNCNQAVVEAVREQAGHILFRRLFLQRRSAPQQEWIRYSSRTAERKQMKL